MMFAQVRLQNRVSELYARSTSGFLLLTDPGIGLFGVVMQPRRFDGSTEEAKRIAMEVLARSYVPHVVNAMGWSSDIGGTLPGSLCTPGRNPGLTLFAVARDHCPKLLPPSSSLKAFLITS